jgi:NACHT domain
MRNSAQRRLPFIFVATPLVMLLLGAAWLVFVWTSSEGGAAAADPQASVLSFVLAAAIAVLGLVLGAWRRRRQASLPATAEEIDHAAATLAGLVREQWQAEARARSLGDPEPMPVRWRLVSPSLMDGPEIISPDRPLVFAGSSDRPTTLIAAFRSLPRRRLIITGGPGAGKSTLAVQMLLGLLPAPMDSPTEPVPVLFSLSSWDPQKHSRLQEWLTDQLEQNYPSLGAINGDAAAALAAQGRLLPVLDGLDEVDPTRRARILSVINSSIDSDGGLILTSRRNDYRDAVASVGDVLTAAAVIGPLALTASDAAGFLRRHLPSVRQAEWEPTFAALEHGHAHALAANVATPLGLWLVRTIYCDDYRSPVPLTDLARFPDHKSLQSHLLDEFIPAVIRSRPPQSRRRRDAIEAPLRPSRTYRSEDLRRWLSTLARQLAATPNRPRSTDWQWWQMAEREFSTVGARLAARLTVALAVGLVLGLVAAGIGGQAGMLGGLVVGFTVGLRIKFFAAPRYANLRLHNRLQELARQLAIGLASGLVFGLIIGLVISLASNQRSGLLLGLALGLTIQLSESLVNFLRAGDDVSISPRASYRGDRTFTLSSALAYGPVFGFTLGLIFGLGAESYPELGVGIAPGLNPGLAGLISGLIIGPISGIAVEMLPSAWLAFIIACLPATASRRLPPPWRLMRVLQDAHRLGLLRSIGPTYQFRHIELQDHLAR